MLVLSLAFAQVFLITSRAKKLDEDDVIKINKKIGLVDKEDGTKMLLKSAFKFAGLGLNRYVWQNTKVAMAITKNLKILLRRVKGKHLFVNILQENGNSSSMNADIAKISLTSSIDINVPTKELLAVEKKSSFVLVAAAFR